MRRPVHRTATLAVIALGACGRGAPSTDEHAGPSPSAPSPAITADPSDRCDPREARVCVGNDVVACEPDGTLGRRLRACRDGCDDGECVPTCADDNAGLIYVIDDAGELLRFDPRKLPHDPFEMVGVVRCPGRHHDPFSMSIDRHGVAWVGTIDGQLFKVSTTDARCRPTPFVASRRFPRFGMGFVTDSPGGTTEKLYIASNDPSHDLGTIDTASGLRTHTIGVVAAAEEHNPELTGTSEARLFGFFPTARGPSFVQEIDRTTGAAVGRRWPLGKTQLGGIGAYAFAQWGGVFYAFIETFNDAFESDATVRAIDRATGSYRVVLHHLPYRIVGAGVSTCAPERGQ
ncbi:MAG TPA: hypothetical protein VFK02_32440 [Kofleriaceae bacterium]|nr:hypothetical protein [Kofleriaceae bacterium]